MWCWERVWNLMIDRNDKIGNTSFWALHTPYPHALPWAQQIYVPLKAVLTPARPKSPTCPQNQTGLHHPRPISPSSGRYKGDLTQPWRQPQQALFYIQEAQHHKSTRHLWYVNTWSNELSMYMYLCLKVPDLNHWRGKPVKKHFMHQCT